MGKYKRGYYLCLKGTGGFGYFVVDYDIVWNIIKKELPDLKTKIKEILKDLEEEQT